MQQTCQRKTKKPNRPHREGATRTLTNRERAACKTHDNCLHPTQAAHGHPMLLHQPHAPGISRESAKQGWQKESVADSQ
ncbi:hypothetical protein SB781_31970, partial [Paraburkholderia sp. SIMBA_061]